MVDKVILAFIFWIVAASLDGVMDIIEKRWRESSLKANIKHPWWNEWFGSNWRKHYIDGDPKKGIIKLIDHFPYPAAVRKFLLKIPGFKLIPTPPQLWDGWHFVKMLRTIFLFSAILCFSPFGWIGNLVLVGVFFLLWWFGFSFIFEYLGLQPEHRRDYFRTIFDFRKKRKHV